METVRTSLRIVNDADVDFNSFRVLDSTGSKRANIRHYSVAKVLAL